jgi:hypothetical protein
MSARISDVTRRSTTVLAVSLVFYTAGVGAQTQRDPAAAEALYRSARDLLKAGDWAAACPKFRASHKLDPVASTLLNIARCHEQEGKLSRAWADYRSALVLNQETPGEERKQMLDEIARQGLASLEPRLPKLRLVLEGEPPPGIKITRDGQPVPMEMLGELVPADPGSQEIVAEAPGYRTKRITVSLEEGKSKEVEIGLTPDPHATPVPGSMASDPDRDAPADTGLVIPTWSWIAAGAGVLLVGAGVGFRLDGAAAERRLEDNCGPELRCDPARGYDPGPDNDRKNRDFALFVGFGAAGAAAIGAAVIGVALSQPGRTTGSARDLRVVAAPGEVKLRLAF